MVYIEDIASTPFLQLYGYSSISPIAKSIMNYVLLLESDCLYIYLGTELEEFCLNVSEISRAKFILHACFVWETTRCINQESHDLIW